MSESTVVRQALYGNPDVVVVKEVSAFYPIPQPTALYAGDEITFWIAPREGLYEVDKLNDFLSGLAAGFKPLKPGQRNFCLVDLVDEKLEFGNLMFGERIGKGKKKTVISATITDKDLLEHGLDGSVADAKFNFRDGKLEFEYTEDIIYNRVINVNVYPDEDIARHRAANRPLFNHITLKNLRRIGRKKGRI